MRKRYLGFVLLPFLLFLLFGKSTLYRWLATTDRTDAAVLIVEGWTTQEGLEAIAGELAAFDYQRVLVTSLAFPFDSTHPYEVTSKGGLMYDFSERALSPQDSITIVAASQSLQGIPAHFRLWVNDSLTGEAWTEESLTAYPFAVSDTARIRKIVIEFDNDGFEEGVGDRNLLVQAVHVGEQTFYARTRGVYVDRGALDGQKLQRTNHRSEADQTADFLRQSGVPDSMLTSVAAPPTDYDRTYAAAQAARDWLQQQPGGPPIAVNLGSTGTHARRSRLLYQKAFGDDTLVGVISLPRQGVKPDTWWTSASGILYVLEQISKYVYVRLFFWPSA